MRKLGIFLILSVFIFGGCTKTIGENEEVTASDLTSSYQADSVGELPYRCVWISYIEIMARSESSEDFSSFLEESFEGFEKIGITDVFFHLRPFGDALYPSQIYPSSAVVCMNQGDELICDYLSLALEKAEKYSLRLHAWINPYRASMDDDINNLSSENKAGIWYREGSNSVVAVDGRFYFNPAYEQVRQLIISGVCELLENYPSLAGVHIDDYFYPENWGNADSEEYDSYLADGGELSLAKWRCENVNMLVRSLYSTVKSYGENKFFTISPAGKIENCTEKLYADVKLWSSEDGYCDMLLPQIYFGFENETQPFGECLEEWIDLASRGNVILVPALALYKCGKTDNYAGSGKNEWVNNSDVIKRQVELIKTKGLRGFALYSGSYVNFSESFYEKELDNLMSVL